MTRHRYQFRRSLIVAALCILLVPGASGQGSAGQETALQKFKRWLADRLKIDFVIYDRVTRFRGGATNTSRAVTLRVFDRSIDKETHIWNCSGCNSPVMIGPAEVLVLSGDGHLIGYHLSNRNSTQYSGQPSLAMLVAGLPAEHEFIGLVPRDGAAQECKLKARVFAIRDNNVIAALDSPEACVDSMDELFLPSALRNEKLIQASQGPLRKLSIHGIVQAGGEYLIAPGNPVSKTLDNDSVSRFSPVWIDDTRILYLADK